MDERASMSTDPAATTAADPPQEPDAPERPAVADVSPRPARWRGWLRHRRLLLTLALVAAVGAGAASGGFAGAAVREHASGRTWPAPPTRVDPQAIAITPGELEALAARRTAALKDGDLPAFVADVDPASSALRASQTALFHNLRKIGFQEATYRVQVQPPHAADAYGRAVTVRPTVRFRHAIRGFDRHVGVESYRWTVRKSTAAGKALLTAVDGAVAGTYDPASMWPAPWDRWPRMTVLRGSRVLMLVDASAAAVARRHLPHADRAAADIHATWRAAGGATSVATHHVLSWVPSRREYDRLYRVAPSPKGEVGRAMAVPNADDHRAEAAGSRLLIDGAAFARAPQPEIVGILRHEFAHAMVEPLGNYRAAQPDMWVTEGFAEWIAMRNLAGVRGRTSSAREAARGRPLELAPDADWRDGRRTNLQYYLAHQAYRYLERRYGIHAVPRLFAAVSGGTELDTALRRTAGTGLAAFEAAALRFARGELA